MNKNNYTSIIIGAGQIAGGYDDLQSSSILTHAHAYCLHKNIELKGFYDIDFEKACLMAKKWDTKAIKTLEDVNYIDIISICTPDEYHLQSIQQAIKLNPKIIFLEKPLSNKKEDVKKIMEVTKFVSTLVNYSRRFCIEFETLASQIKNGYFGEYQTGSGYYGKGLIHNGSHMLDLINMLLGKIKNITEITKTFDFYENDPSKSVVIDLQDNKKFYMQAVDCNNYTICELDLFFAKNRIRIINLGYQIEFFEIKESDDFAGYKNPVYSKTVNTSLNCALYNAVDNIYNFLERKEPLKCTQEDGFAAIKNIFGLIEK